MKQIIALISVIFFISYCTNSKETINNVSPEYVIAYNAAVKDSSGNTNYEVFAMDFDGSNVRNISKSKDVAWTYHGYNQNLYFISDRDTSYRCFFLYETNFDGDNFKKVCELQLEDSWMDTRYNGKEIIASGRIGNDVRFQLFIINTATGEFNQITNDTAAIYRDPVFSKDGNQIVCSYKKNKRDKTQNEELYILNADGTHIKQLTYYPQENVSRNSHGYKAGAAHWHPTENFISYISMQNGKHNIFAVTPDGSKQWKLTDHDYSEGWHDWSSDGKWLVFDMANQEETQFHIMLMNWETKEVTQLTDTTFKYQQSPVFILKK